MGKTVEKRGLFVKPERLRALRSVWASADIDVLLDHQVSEKLQLELSRYSNDTTLIRIYNPGPLIRFPKPYIVAELGFRFESDGYDVATDLPEKEYHVTPVYRLLLDENWLYGKYRGQGESKLVRPETIGKRNSVWSLVEQHIDRARKLSFE